MATKNTSEEVGAAVPASPPRENLIRAVAGINLERSDGATMPTLTGHFSVWNDWTEIHSQYEGHFLERFTPSSMTKTLSEHTPKVLFQHGRDPQIGDKPLGRPTRIEPDQVGAFYEVDLLDTSYNRDLLPGLEAGLYGASFRFSVLRENVVRKPKRSDFNPQGLPERTVEEARVMEFGPVTFPAYANATAGVRSMTDEFLIDDLIRKPELARRAGISLAGLNPRGSEARFDNEDTACLAQMVVLASGYIDEQDEPSDADAGTVMQGVVKTLVSLMQGELTEPEPADEPEDEENSAKQTDLHDRAEEPEPSAATTPTEPEPSEATTRSDWRDLLWFAPTP